MIHLLELEPLKERYTEWWSHYIPSEIRKRKRLVNIISGDTLSDKVVTGTVLDAGATNYWKAEQLKKVSEMFYKGKVKAYDHFLIADIWFPGIEMLPYMSHLYKVPIKIWGVWHAGSSTNNDFAQPMHEWSKYFEIGFLNICDGIFVGSAYSKFAIIERLLYSLSPEKTNEIAHKIHDYGMPLDFESLQQYSSNAKEKIIIFPHRPDVEKNPHIYLAIIQGLSLVLDDFSDYKFIFCTSKEEYISQDAWINAMLAHTKMQFENVEVHAGLSKKDYYTLLGRSKLMISTTAEENFGYCIVEAMALGCRVLAPNAFSHPEILDENMDYMYDDYNELLAKIPRILEEEHSSIELKALVEPYSDVVREWVKTMRA